MTKTLVHSSPIGALEIPGVVGAIPPGEPFAVDDAIAESLLEQADLYTLAPSASAQAAPKKGTAK
jgi:hypothetical protein